MFFLKINLLTKKNHNDIILKIQTKEIKKKENYMKKSKKILFVTISIISLIILFNINSYAVSQSNNTANNSCVEIVTGPKQMIASVVTIQKLIVCLIPGIVTYINF